MKTLQLFLTLGFALTLTACKKEYITQEGDNYYDLDPDIYSWTQSTGNVPQLDIDANSSMYDQEDRIGEFNIGRLEIGDRIIVESQIRLRDVGGCSSDMRVQSGPLVSSISGDTPGSADVIPFGNGHLGYAETWHADEDLRFFNRIYSGLVTSTVDSARVSLWANIYDSGCAGANGVEAQLGSIVVTVHRAN